MRLASKGGIGWREAQAFRLFRLRKRVRQFLKYRPGCAKTVLFIVGCQRSGTTLLHHVLRRDPDSVTFDEVSLLSDPGDPERLRWKPPAEVSVVINSCRAPFVVTKPLVESQNLQPWRDVMPGSRVVWMFRGFRDVARSNLAFFGRENGLNDLRPILVGDHEDWRFQHLDKEVVAAIRELAAGPLSPEDAAALFWYARNSLFFSTMLNDDPDVSLCRYEDLVTRPANVVNALYRWLGRPFPGESVLVDIAESYSGQGNDLVLSPAVEEICMQMEGRLLREPRLATG